MGQGQGQKRRIHRGKIRHRRAVDILGVRFVFWWERGQLRYRAESARREGDIDGAPPSRL